MTSIIKVDQIQSSDGTTEYLNAGNIKNATLDSTVTGGSGITALGTVASAGAITTSNPINFTGSNHTFTVKAVNQPITGATNSTNDDANSDQLAIYNGSTKLWGINESGFVTNPNAPGFTARGYSSYISQTGISEYSNNGEMYIFLYNQITYNIGNHFDNTNGRFTAPISGRYLFNFNHGHKAAANYMGTGFIYNGNYNIFQHWSNNDNNHHFNGGSLIVNMSAGDFLAVGAYPGYTLPSTDNWYTNFNGILLS